MSSETLSDQRERLFKYLSDCKHCVVALSGGVDSAVIAAAAFRALGDRAVAVTANSPSLAVGELETARQIARQIGIRHEVIATHEFAQPAYVRNATDRCYHCKTELYRQLEEIAARYPEAVIVNGANLDDEGDFRPGMLAAREHQVRSPLLDCGLTKADVRRLAADWGLAVWNKPATPCLSSRVAYGEKVTPERLAMVDAAEQYLRGCGLSELRVRYHRGDLARLEVPLTALPQLVEEQRRADLVQVFRQLGFKFVTLDLEGFRSGNLNQLVSLSTLSDQLRGDDVNGR